MGLRGSWAMLLYPRALPGLLSLFSLPLNTRLCCCTLCGGMAFCVVRTICHVVYPVMMHATMRVNLFFPSLRAGEALKPHTKPDPEKKTRVHPHRQSQFYGLGSIPKSSLSGFPSALNPISLKNSEAFFYADSGPRFLKRPRLW